MGEFPSVWRGSFSSFSPFGTEFIFELSHGLFQPGCSCNSISTMSPTPEKLALTEVISQLNQHGSLSFGDSNIACNPTGPLHHFKVAHQNFDHVARQETELKLVKLTHLEFPRPAAANNAPTDLQQPISKCMSVMNTTSCVDPYLPARKASNRNDHFILEFAIFRLEINEQINRRNEKRRENRLNALLESEVSAANYYLLLHGRAAVMIGLLLWGPLLYTH